MRPPESFVGQPIRALQTMLRVIMQDEGSGSPLVPDGIYGPETAGAVTEFQKQHGLPVTGLTDDRTWNAILAAYRPAKIDRVRAQPLYILLNPGQVIHKGQAHPHVFLVQGMLAALSQVYDSIPLPGLTGVLDDGTSDALAAFQMLSGLPMTGNLDKVTWKNLVLQYPLGANINNGESQQENMDKL